MDLSAAHTNSEGVRVDPEVNFFGLTNYRNQNRKFGIKIDDRRRHVYVVGKTGMGKTTLLENMVLNDIYAGHGIGLVDPHGDFAEKILNFVPANRINDVVYFNPADIEYPIGFNILESVNEEYKHLVASGLMGVFKKIWPDVWSARMEYILNNTILALLDFPGTTLLGINRLLADDDYRAKVIATLKDPVVKAFWDNEFEKYDERFRREAIAPIQNKIGQFLSASIIRNIVAQVKSRINIREIMDTRKIFIMNLSKGRIGEDNSRLLGGMLITKIQLSAMERVDTPEKERKDFFLYVDEFQNFATESFAHILSEARKYRLDLTMAHQYMAQLDETVLAAVIGNVGTMISFRVGSTDSEILAKEFIPTFLEEDLINLPKFHIYLKLMIDGVASRPFSALTMSPIGSPTGNLEKVVNASRERYAIARNKIEEKISKWSGMSGDDLAYEEQFGEKEDATEENKESDSVASTTVQKETSNFQQNKTVNNGQLRPSSSKPNFSQKQNSQQFFKNQPKNKSKNPENKNSQNNQQFQKNRKPIKSFTNKIPTTAMATESVVLVDTTQKGVSLQQMLDKKPVRNFSQPKESTFEQKISPTPSLKKDFSSKETAAVPLLKKNNELPEKQTQIAEPKNSSNTKLTNSTPLPSLKTEQKNITIPYVEKKVETVMNKTISLNDHKINSTGSAGKNTSKPNPPSTSQFSISKSSSNQIKPLQKDVPTVSAPSASKILKPGEIIKFD